MMMLAILFWSSVVQYVTSQHACESNVFCYGDILKTVQKAQLFLDPKRFVDMPTKFPKAQVIDNFRKLNDSPSTQELIKFLKENFHKAGKELRIIMPKDFKANITLLSLLSDEKLREFASEVHSKWKSLLRKVDKTHICMDCESTVIDLPYPFLVPGGRFREYYYWDTYWILEGIYVSEMCETARMVVENTLWMAKKYGFVPNGSRTYYLNRSQPPMLPMIVERYYEECGKNLRNPQKILKGALDALRGEHSFWMTKRSARVQDRRGNNHTLNFYSADMNDPRPESYLHDVKIAKNMSKDQSERLFHNIAATTESGWDFSGRWLNWTLLKGMTEIPGLELSRTSDILPVDLNAVLFRNELIISKIAALCNETSVHEDYKKLADSRIIAIHEILFSTELNMWKDYDLSSMRLMTSRPFYITDICPLWYGPYDNITLSQTEEILKNQSRILNEYPGGIPISEVYTGQQWDFPNVWAPTQFHVVKLYLRLFRETQNQKHYKTALSVAQRWIDTTYCAYKHYGYFFEKYNAKLVGQPGSGGEYIVQEGFGWTNGAILWILKHLGPDLMVPIKCPSLPVSSYSEYPSISDASKNKLVIWSCIAIGLSIVSIALYIYVRRFHRSYSTVPRQIL